MIDAEIRTITDDFTGNDYIVLDQIDDLLNLPVYHIRLVYGTAEISGDMIAQYKSICNLV